MDVTGNFQPTAFVVWDIAIILINFSKKGTLFQKLCGTLCTNAVSRNLYANLPHCIKMSCTTGGGM